MPIYNLNKSLKKTSCILQKKYNCKITRQIIKIQINNDIIAIKNYFENLNKFYGVIGFKISNEFILI